ncbi:MAG TPA: hypothetical protein VF519_07485 [Mycobacteriales bacterium]
MTRFRDTGETLYGLSGEVLVVCPACGGCARVVAARGVCPACAWTATPSRKGFAYGTPHDPYLDLPLWLVTGVGGETLWAYNAEHLDLIEAFVSATLRERVADRTHYTLVERLPAWLKAAGNRDAVLAGVARLRERLP